ncbi:MAG: UDP-N-acetylmuramoyl-L-alanine--D-glutamate ligase [Kiritimatiellae bacterium]|nr:UDP-N-acetylmuramoyl-L-alanine--D-glutamate ligase [Kiritimatiellia bacterium]MDW8457566.1 UDP-N-acetylmuramoyl-L-alanine--D-glutamate ligase [Verrucomicrobiota bacterium]
MRHAVILGAGESGLGAALLLRKERARVTVWDRAPSDSALAALHAIGVSAVPTGDRPPWPSDADLCVISPGIPLSHPWVRQALEHGIPIVPEFELGWSRFSGKTLAITGTNGKSTMVKWAAESLQAAGLRAAPCGNYGPSVCRVVAEKKDLDWLVIEASSFQLEASVRFRADIGILLNIAPNHLDRHGTMDAYISAKSRLFANVGSDDWCLSPPSWLDRMRAAAGGRGRWLTFGVSPECDAEWRPGSIVLRHGECLRIQGTYFDNPVLGPHAAAVAASFVAAGLPIGALETSAREFEPLPHRMQKVAESRGVTFIDDSKSTTLSAMSAALQMAPGPVRLIAGGLLKQSDLDSVKQMLACRARTVYLIGASTHAMKSAWSDVVPCRVCGSLEDAIRAAWSEAERGDVILLSPGCASFDQFANYIERGVIFRRIAESIARSSA